MYKFLTIFKYELKRILFTKTYLFLTIISLVYGYYVLRTQTLVGAYHTAPYSQWSSISYLHAIFPIICTLPLVSIANQHGKKQQQAQVVPLGTPTAYRYQKACRFAAVGLTYFINLLLCIALNYIFFAIMLKHTPSLNLLLCMCLLSIPQFLLTIGISLWLGALKPNLVYVLIGVLFFVAFAELQMPMQVDLLGNSILSVAASSIPQQGVIPFIVPNAYLFNRIIVFIVGLLLTIFACGQKRKLS